MAQSISMLTTYPPTHCGIASFSHSLVSALDRLGIEVSIGDLSDPDTTGLVRTLNGADVAMVQHEFGIFRGEAGASVLDIIGKLGVPTVTVLHTVPESPSGAQRSVLQRLLDVSDAVVTLSYSAARALRRVYEVRPRSLHVIPHGVDDLWHHRRPHLRSEATRFLTWGLIGRGKGLEWMLHAISRITDVDPLPEYTIAGRTHPKVLEREGGAYLQELRAMAQDLGVDNRVHFIEGYLGPERLRDLIGQADAFVLPYDNDDQVTSGVLVESIAAGGPVIATRFPHAREMLSAGAGLLVNRRNADQLAAAVRTVMTDPARTRVMRQISVAASRDLLWSRVAEQYVMLADELTAFDERRQGPPPLVQIPLATGTGR
jgi:polysaccharide biosynthesis protein PslF